MSWLYSILVMWLTPSASAAHKTARCAALLLGGTVAWPLKRLTCRRASCLLYTSIEVLPPYESRSYVDLTIDAMQQFGVKVAARARKNGSVMYRVAAPQR